MCCCGRGREKFSAVLLPGKGFIGAAKGRQPGLIKPVHRLRLKTSFFFEDINFQGFGLLRAGPLSFSRPEKYQPCSFSRGRTGASPWHCRRGISSSQCQTPFSAKGFSGSLKQEQPRGWWLPREKGASVGESVPPRVLRPAELQTGIDADIPAVQGALPKVSAVQVNLTIRCRVDRQNASRFLLAQKPRRLFAGP